MSETVQASAQPDASLGGYLQPPEISPELAERSVATLTRISLGEHTVNTCNPAIADIDGDGLDEIVIPHNRGEQDVIAAYRGDGSKVWETTEAPFYHAVYDDDELYARSHWHYRSHHRHLLTFVCDLDGDGALEVVCGLGPIHVLDAATGRLKDSFDLDGLAQVWSLARLDESGGPCIAAAVNHHREHGSVLAMSGSGEVLWQHETVGQSFEDFMRCGDLTGDGLDEICFSMADAERFEVRDAAGEVLWAKHVPSEIGEDTHVDDLVIGEILPEGRQLATATGGCLFDAQGNLLWSLNDQIEHGQKIACAQPPGLDEPLIYLNSKTTRRAWGISPRGEFVWEYDNFSRKPDGSITLTSAGDWVDWSAPGACEIVQSELMVNRGDAPAEEGTPLALYLTILSPEGEEVAKLPYQDILAPGFNGAMCCLSGHLVTRDRHDIAVITHNNSEVLIFSP